jgi:hypothetical protein
MDRKMSYIVGALAGLMMAVGAGLLAWWRRGLGALLAVLVASGAWAQPTMEEVKLLASDGAASDELGHAVAIEGNRMVVGADLNDHVGNNAGAVYVYEYDGVHWIESKIIASDGAAGDLFGTSVSVSGDRILVGSPSDDDNGGDSGSAYVYDWDGSAWVGTKLVASDAAAGDLFGTSVSVSGDRILIGSRNGGDSGSAYVYDWDGITWMETKLVASDGAANDQFGISVSVSGDRILVGANFDDDNGSGSGSAYVYDWDGSSWVETKLVASDAATSDRFGSSVSISGDRILVGSVFDDDNGSNSGSAYVYDWNGSSWVETKLVASDAVASGRFGQSVSVSGDRILVGALLDDNNGNGSGSAYVYDWDGSTWIESKIIASDGAANDYFGSSVSVSGNHILIGAYSDDDNGIDAGAAYVYTSSKEVKVLAGSGAAGDWLGSAVAIEGNRMVVGAREDDQAALDAGAAYVYEYDGTDWIETVKLMSTDAAAGDRFGGSVSISGDRVVVGAYRDDDAGSSTGSAYVYHWDGTNWNEQPKLTASDAAAGDSFGISVSVSGDRVVVGAHGADDGGTDSGSAYVYDWNGSAWVQTQKLTASDPAANDYFSLSVSVSGDRVVVGAWGNDDDGTDSGSAYVFDWDGTNWIEQPKLTASDAAGNDRFGNSVSVSGDRVVVGAWGNDDDGTDSGSAYVYEWDGTNWIEQPKLTAADAAGDDRFGRSVSVSSDRVAVGALGDDDGGTDSGSIYVYEWDGSGWVETKLTALDAAAGDSFGNSVSVSGDRVAVSANLDDNANGIDAGAAYVISLQLDPIELSLPGLTAKYNQNLSIPLSINQFKDVVAIEAFIEYDASVLTYTGVTMLSGLATLPEEWTLVSNDEASAGNLRTVKIAMAVSQNNDFGPSKLADVHFTMNDLRAAPVSTALVFTNVLLNDGTPASVGLDGSVLLVGINGTLTALPTPIVPRDDITVTVVDVDENRDVNALDSFTVSVRVYSDVVGGTLLDDELLTLTETGNSTGEFSGVMSTVYSASQTSFDGALQTQSGQVAGAFYSDLLDGFGNGPIALTAQVDILGGADGAVAATLVTQPGDPVYIQVTDADLNANSSSAETASVTVTNSRTAQSVSVLLTEVDVDDEVFFGSLATVPGAGTASEMGSAEDDVLTVTYDDVLTLVGSQVDRTAPNDVIDPWGDADDNESLQAFDAARVLLYLLNPGANPIDVQASNVDITPVTSGILAFDAALILQKRVGLISSFPVQDPTSTNHPQGTAASAKITPLLPSLSLVAGDGYVSLVADQRDEIVSGDVLLEGVGGRVVMGDEYGDFLTAQKVTDEGTRIVFAGAESVRGSGELLRVYGVGPQGARLVRAAFNNTVESAATTDVAVVVPQTYALSPNAPNPFNPSTSISFALPEASAVKLVIFDALGQTVRTLVDERRSAGRYTATWDGRNAGGLQVSSGVYFYRLAAGDFRQMRRMMLIK